MQPWETWVNKTWYLYKGQLIQPKGNPSDQNYEHSIISYLPNRCRNRYEQDSKQINYGVLQGSILGPTFVFNSMGPSDT